MKMLTGPISICYPCLSGILPFAHKIPTLISSVFHHLNPGLILGIRRSVQVAGWEGQPDNAPTLPVKRLKLALENISMNSVASTWI